MLIHLIYAYEEFLFKRTFKKIVCRMYEILESLNGITMIKQFTFKTLEK